MKMFSSQSPKPRWRAALALLVVALVAFAPALAEARAGGGSSMGSRGSRTYQSNSARPMERSMTPTPSRPAPGPGMTQPAPGFGTPGGLSFAQRHPFMTGLVGGFIGAGLAGMLFGHSAWAADGGAGAGIGMLLQLLVIAGLIWLVIRMFRRRSEMATAGAQPYARSVGAMAAPAARDPVDIPVTEADYNAWSELLVGVQSAWSSADLGRLRQYVTPEMLSYFSEQLAANSSRGVDNRVEQVSLLKGDVEEAWAEREFEYVTARLRWSAVDYTVRTGTNTVVDGDPSRPQEVSEVWTFVRSRGGHWLLSAIQQT